MFKLFNSIRFNYVLQNVKLFKVRLSNLQSLFKKNKFNKKKKRSHEKDLGRSSGWMFLDAANELFTKARIRVYGTNPKNFTKTELNNRFMYSRENKEMVARIIEESPKLKVLKEILEELGDEENTSNEVNILIVANDDRTCSQIKHVSSSFFLSINHHYFKSIL